MTGTHNITVAAPQPPVGYHCGLLNIYVVSDHACNAWEAKS